MSLLQALTSRMAGTKTYAKAVDFDGTNDYLSRASDLTGNADGKTFTFSAWAWVNDTGNWNYVYSAATAPNGSLRFWIAVNGANGTIQVYGRNSSNTTILACDTSTGANVNNTFVHILVSVDLTNTSNRYMYVNDTAVSPTWSTYTNSDIDFTQPYHYIANDSYTPSCKGRVTQVFLDKTYRDLSVEANRRLFITADRKPAQGQAALNPILYLPMDDPTTAHINQGTGGNFTLNGVVARSGRGPNQFNAPYSDLDGAADYVSKTGALLGSGSKTITFSCAFNPDSVTTDQYLFGFWTSVTTIAQIFGVYIGADGSFGALGQVSPGTGTYILNAGSAAGVLKAGRNYTLQISIDLSDTGKRFVYLNGEAVSMTWTTYTDDYIYLNQASNSPITSAGRSRTFYFNGRLGNVFFHTSYIDLSVPANLAKFVTGTGIDAKPADLGANGELPFGTAPLIYLPMYGNNAGKNYGTGGDFTVNSGPFLGARGPNEFWGNKAVFSASPVGALGRESPLGGVSNSKIVSCSVFFTTPSDFSSRRWLFNVRPSDTFLVELDGSTGVLKIWGGPVNFTSSSGLSANTAYHLCFNFDLADTGKRSVFLNAAPLSGTWVTYTNSSVVLTGATPTVGAGFISSGNYGLPFVGSLSEFYFTTDYIDFSQEANRLKFRDAFGSPVALLPQIEAGAIPAPAIYLRFDPADQGRNDGTGGNFTKSGTITDGGQL